MDWSLILLVALVLAVIYLDRRLTATEKQLRQISEHLERTRDLMERIERNTEKTAEYLYAQTDEYRQHVAELERLRP